MLSAILALLPAIWAPGAVGLLLAYYILPVLLDPLREIPGPFLARFSRLWYFLEIYKGSYEITDIDLHKRHGSIVRIAPGEYSIEDPEAAKIIYGHGSTFLKAPWYSGWTPPYPNMANLFSDSDPHRHAFQRRKFAALYTMSSMVGYENLVNDCMDLINQRFSELAKLGKSFDLAHWLQCYAFDVIGDITFADRFGFLDMGEDKGGVFQAIDTRSAYSTFAGVFPRIHKIIFPWLPKTGGYGYVLEYTKTQIAKRQGELRDPKSSSTDGPPDIMTKILSAHEADSEKMTRQDMVTMCLSNIGAGSDTTAITLSSIFYHLIQHPQTMHKLRNEIDTAHAAGTISDPITFKEAQGLPYLQAVIKEGLRIHPATGLGLQRIVPNPGMHLSGQFFPGGSTVGINAWVAHQNTSIYGPDASAWRPERWIEFEEQGRTGEVEKYFLSFGLGSRTCFGKNISLLEMSKLVPFVLRRFDFRLAEEEMQDGVWATKSRWFVKVVDFRVRVSERMKEG
ncbi:hypothetical protein BP6252_07990 [Coleophoma cylindrospora]|uniref:Cytochrome P450 n=1 Tax=Coleophoma cylindrospora TaxID=1849047 RepID=A0A3D8RBJ8_9HELO|nr:hypothetical protein BP6252_07990 [Coleophoma cylindrospora]